MGHVALTKCSLILGKWENDKTSKNPPIQWKTMLIWCDSTRIGGVKHFPGHLVGSPRSSLLPPHRLVQEPNSFFMDVRCADCFTITTVFSHAQTVVYCSNCSTMLCTPTGGHARLSEGCSYRKKTM